ncbi:MAG: YebC/PmpR family DNA-binding transcriptional regulator, partial [Bacillota bacterium]
WLANNTIELDDEDLNSFKRFLALAEDTEDIQDVYHNVKLKEEDE